MFSLKEANQTLPLVSRIMDDIVQVNDELAILHAKERELAGEGRSVRAEALRDRMADLGHRIVELIDELERIGCACKDPAVGLVDFPARMDDRFVFLCWKRGEAEIRFWHELDTGFAGRKPVRGAFA